LFHQNRRLLERVRLVESTIANAPDTDPGRTALSAGMAAPLFELPTLDGGRLGLAELLAAQGRIASPVAVGGAAIRRLLVAAFPRELVPAQASS
jgi:hypothetical protein